MHHQNLWLPVLLCRTGDKILHKIKQELHDIAQDSLTFSITKVSVSVQYKNAQLMNK